MQLNYEAHASIRGDSLIPAVTTLLDDLNQQCARVGSGRHFGLPLLLERAGLTELTAGGRESCNGSCRLLESRDAWIAVNLARDRDRESVPALLRCEVAGEPWDVLTRAVRSLASSELVADGRLLGIPIARVGTPLSATSSPRAPCSVRQIAPTQARLRDWTQSPPVVLDLSALWAGPLCGHILASCGARVIKIESSRRRDSIHTSFFERLNAGKHRVVLDFEADREQLEELIRRADVVISSARPRAFVQLGLEPERLLSEIPGLTWVAITAYGWDGPDSHAVGFGDDVAAAAGLVSWSAAGPAFVGDAIADPLTGIVAATTAIEAVCAGGGALLDSSLYASARHVAQQNSPLC